MFPDSLDIVTRSRPNILAPSPIRRYLPIFSGVVFALLLPVLGGCHSPDVESEKNETTSQSSRTATKTASKINANLLELERRVQQDQLSLEQAGKNMAISVSDEGIKLEIVTSNIDDRVEKQLSIPGVTVHHVSRKYNRISASVRDLALMHELAQVPEVIMIKPQYAPHTH